MSVGAGAAGPDPAPASPAVVPPGDCPLCPRLAAFRTANRAQYPDFHNAPVAGDFAGDLLYATLSRFGFTQGHYGARADDGLALDDARITNGVRCVPPENKPVGAEIAGCRPYLASEIAAMARLRVILALGVIAHNGVLAALGHKRAAYPFGHGAQHQLPDGPLLAASYHCSRYNTNTGRLTTNMFEAVFADLRRHLDKS